MDESTPMPNMVLGGGDRVTQLVHAFNDYAFNKEEGHMPGQENREDAVA